MNKWRPGFKTSITFIGSLLIFSILFTSCVEKDDVMTEKERLLETDRQFAAMSIEKGAAEAFYHFLAEDAMGLNGPHPVIGRDKLYAEMKDGSPYTLAWEPQRAEVSKSADMGWSWGTYVLTRLDEAGEEQKSYGKYLNVWERQEDGEWKVVVDVGTPSPAPEN